MSKIYLASPYSHPDKDVRYDRWMRAAKLYAQLVKDGHIVYCPIAFCHPIATFYKLPTDNDFWKRVNKVFIDWAEIFMILCLDGWGDSKGIRWELAVSITQGMEVVFEDPV